MHSTIMNYVGEQSVPIAWVLAGMVGMFWAADWADTRYVTALEAAQSAAEIQSAIDESNKLLTVHLVEYARNELRKEIEMVRSQQYELKQFIALNGTNSLAETREKELANDLTNLMEVRTCMNAGRDNCR